MTLPDQESIALDSSAMGGAGEFPALLKVGRPELPGIVLLHGRNSNADGAVVGLLRRTLHGDGYTTLSVANPLPRTGDEFADYLKDQSGENYVFPEAAARVLAAIGELKRRNIASVFLLGFSMGARLHSAFLGSGVNTPLPVRGFVALSIGVNGTGPLNAINTLSKVAVPAIDVSGAGDKDVAASMASRQAAYQSGPGPSYEVVVLDGAVPHNFAGAEDQLEKTVRDWLRSRVPA
jgi:pimeloyl-ACP methyl ester carboxylesterase